MAFLYSVTQKSSSSLILFALAALLLAFNRGNVDRIVVRLVIEFPLLLLLAAIMTFIIQLAAEFSGAVVIRARLAGALVAGLMAWAMAAPPEFAGLGYHSMLRPAFVMALALPWLVPVELLTRFWKIF